VPRNTHAPLTFPGTLSSTGHCAQSIVVGVMLPDTIAIDLLRQPRPFSKKFDDSSTHSALTFPPKWDGIRATMRLTFVVLAICAPLGAAENRVDFEKQVQPLLSQRCYGCHGPDVQQSGLRLDKRQNAMRGGDYGPVIIPGKSAESKLIRRVVNGDGALQMPPTGPLSSEEINLLRAWIDQGADYRMEIQEEAPPKPIKPEVATLISAVRTGAPSDVEKLLKTNPGIVNSPDQAGNTPLHHAAAFGSLGTMKLLLDKGADVNAKNKRASTPLHWAIPNEPKVKMLLDRGADINKRQADGRTPLYNVASAGNANSILKLLLERGADPNLATANGQTPLMAAAGRGDVEAIRLLVTKKADVNAQNGAGATSLMAAAASRNSSAVKTLLELAADPNVLTKKNESALSNAATAGSEESVKLLLDRGAKVNVSDDRGYSALMYAAGSESIPAGIVKLLLAKGADPNCTGEGETPHSLAAKRGDTEVARLLGVPAEERKQGGVAPLPPARAAEQSIPDAVQKALALLQSQSHNFIRIAGCNSCHSQNLPSAALGLARDHGIKVINDIPQLTVEMNGETPERLMDLVAAGVSSIGWEMFDRGMNHTPADRYTDATVHYMKAMQTPEGYWKGPDGRRPPMNSGDLQTSALAIYSLKTFAPAAEREETQMALTRAAAWLNQTRPSTTQERAFQLMGLVWAKAAPVSIEQAAAALAVTQREDGGWSQLAGMGSDAYATGQALYALHASGRVAAGDVIYQKGVSYLLRAQAPDGSWHVKTRSIWTQPYFDAGFPYGQEQFISAAGTGWASLALSVAVEAPRVSRK
jgi:ankyrin repeat protein